MKWLAIILIVLLTGCKTIPVKPPAFPPISQSMEYRCPDLKEARQSELLSELLDTIIKNYGEYHKCRVAVDVWHQWYEEQKENYERLRNEYSK